MIRKGIAFLAAIPAQIGINFLWLKLFGAYY